MTKPKIYVVQFGTGSRVNLLPLAAGQLYSRLRIDEFLSDRFDLPEIIFRRPDDLRAFAAGLEDVSVIGFSCFLWNVRISLAAAEAVRAQFPDALIVMGGPSIPQEPDDSVDFIRAHPYIDVICHGEGEDVFASLCRCRYEKRDLREVCDIIVHDRVGGAIHRTAEGPLPDMASLPSPFVDGTFDDLYGKYAEEFSGVILETNRGCPFRCSFCSWGNTSHGGIREKTLPLVEAEIDWIGRNKIRYVAMSDSNFGIRERDIAIAEYFARTKARYGYPEFVSMSWVKNSSDKVLKISGILRQARIGFKVTLALQSLNEAALKAANRVNFKREFYENIRQSHHKAFLYSYTELLLGMPLETYESYMQGLEELLSDSVFDQIYSYPLLLFPNARIASRQSRRDYGIVARLMHGKYTKSKVCSPFAEHMEVIVGTDAMPSEKWIDSFVNGYSTIGLHDDRLAFFIFWYLKRQYGVRITDLVVWMREESSRCPDAHPRIHSAFSRLVDCARSVQEQGASHLIELEEYGGVPYDPPDVMFLMLLWHKNEFYAEFHAAVRAFLRHHGISHDESELRDLFAFQNTVVADPHGRDEEGTATFAYDWPRYFSQSFNLAPADLQRRQTAYVVRDRTPCGGNGEKYLAVHFQVRGVPPFNELYDGEGHRVFPPVSLQVTE
jgi:putative methyltransferase